MSKADSKRQPEPRLSTNHPVTLTIFAGNESISIGGRLVDASRKDVGVVVDSPIDVGAVVEVRANGVVAYGEVKHCSSAPTGGFRIGIMIEEDVTGDWLVISR